MNNMAGQNILKKDLVAQVAEQEGFTKKDTEAVVDAVFEALQGHLEDGNAVQLTGFGKFEVTQSAPRAGRNPQTGEELHIPSKNRVKFRVGKNLKDAIESK